MRWTEETRRDRNGQVHAKQWTATVGRWRATIHYYHGLGQALFLSVHPGWYQAFDLATEDIEVAKRTAQERLRKDLEDALQSMEVKR